LDVDVYFGPFTCIAGANGIGKSNVFDAIEFLSYLASDSFAEAAQQVRGPTGIRGADPRDLFWNGFEATEHVIELSAEMLVPREVEDDLGTATEASTTFLRYSVQLAYERGEGLAGSGRLALRGERLTHITKGESRLHLPFPHSVADFRDAVVQGRRSGGAYISTEARDAGIVVNLHGDGGSFGRPQPRAAARAQRTFLSTVTTNDYPTILAAKREMQGWRRLALEPSALRTPDDFAAPRILGHDGRHLAAALYRVAHTPRESRPADPDAVYTRVANRLSRLAGLSIESVTVDLDETREVFTLFVTERGRIRLPARALSEGTLRFLALCTLLEDEAYTGLTCMEEPENGIHPANLGAMMELVQELAVDPQEGPGPDNPFRQVIVNTHSPGVVQLCGTDDLLLASLRPTQVEGGRIRSLTLRPFDESWRARHQRGPTASLADVTAYLVAPEGSQLHLPVGLVG
jgi:predicted ATPase